MRDKTYITVSAHGNLLRAGIPFKRIYRFLWACPVCKSKHEQFTKFVHGATCPRCGHHFDALEYVKNREKRIYPELVRGFSEKPLGALLPLTSAESDFLEKLLAEKRSVACGD
jgi:rubredoxin